MACFNAAEDKRRYSYIHTPRGIAEKTALTGRFLAKRLNDLEALKKEIEELRSGKGMGLRSFPSLFN